MSAFLEPSRPSGTRPEAKGWQEKAEIGCRDGIFGLRASGATLRFWVMKFGGLGFREFELYEVIPSLRLRVATSGIATMAGSSLTHVFLVYVEEGCRNPKLYLTPKHLPFKDLYKEILLGNPNRVGYLGSR